MLMLYSDGSVDVMYPRFECPQLQLDDNVAYTYIGEHELQILHNMYDVEDIYADDFYICIVYNDGSVSETSFYDNYELYHVLNDLENVRMISSGGDNGYLVGLLENGLAFRFPSGFGQPDDSGFLLERFGKIRFSDKSNGKHKEKNIKETDGTIAETIDPYIRPNAKNISDSWEEIISASNDGTYLEKYSIGEKKEIDLGDEGIITMILVAKNRDELSDGSGNANMTWIAQDLLKTEYYMEETEDKEWGWKKSKIRSWLQNTILPSMPSEVQQAIKTVNKYSLYRSEDESKTLPTEDTIWIPSEKEVYTSINGVSWINQWSENSGIDYREAILNNSSLIRTHKDETTSISWWLRTASYRGCLKVVPDSESMSSITQNGVVIGFCL